jgi:hypothetical protein
MERSTRRRWKARGKHGTRSKRDLQFNQEVSYDEMMSGWNEIHTLRESDPLQDGNGR